MIYLSLFVVSFLAGSFVPLGSEAYFLFLQNEGKSLIILLFVASLGNTLGAMSCYFIGRYGGSSLITKYLKYSPEKIELWRGRIDRYHPEWLAFFSWLPFIGELIAAVLGIVSKKSFPIIFFMFLGKLLRYVLLGFLGEHYLTEIFT